MNSHEVRSTPLPSRNPYNFVILQANVTGHPNRGNLYPQVNVNGFLRRTYWQLDGNNNTRGDVAGAEQIQRVVSIPPQYRARNARDTALTS